MRRKRKAIVLTLAALGIVGCAHSDRRLSQPGQPPWRPVSTDRWKERADTPSADTSNIEPPRILPETHFAAGRLFETRGHLAKAIHQYRQATAVNHAYAEAYYRLGVLLSMTGEREEALAALRRAVQLKPDQPVFRNDLGFVLVLSRRWEEAEQEFLRVIAASPGFARAYVNLGIVQSKLGRWEEARASFQAVLPEPDACYNMGLMYRGQQRYEEAREAFERARSLHPGFTAATTQLAQLRLHDGSKLPDEGEVPRGLIEPTDAVEKTGKPQTTPAWAVQDIRGRAGASTDANRADRRPSSPAGHLAGSTLAATVDTPSASYGEADTLSSPKPDSDRTVPAAGESVADQPQTEAHVGGSAEPPTPQRPESFGDDAAPRSLVEETILSLHAMTAIDPRTDLGTLTSIVDNEIECMEEGRTLAFGRSSVAPFGPMGESTLDGQIVVYDANEAEAAFGGELNDGETDEEPCVETLIVFEHVPSPMASERTAIAVRGDTNDAYSTAQAFEEGHGGMKGMRAVETMACTIEPVDEEQSVSRVGQPIASLFDWAMVPTRESDGMAQRAFSPWIPPAKEASQALAAANRIVKLRQLAHQLEITRNEIACLEELDETEAAAMAANRPPDDVTVPTTRARLAATVIEPKPAKTSSEKKQRAKSRAIQPTDDRRRSKGTKPAAGRTQPRRKPKDLPIAWGRAFEKLDDLRAIALNEIHCWQAVSDEPIQPNDPVQLTESIQCEASAQWPEVSEYIVLTPPAPMMGFSSEVGPLQNDAAERKTLWTATRPMSCNTAK